MNLIIDTKTGNSVYTKIIDRLKEGNKRFIESNLKDKDYTEQINATANGQFPFAAVLSCIDSRVPAEIIFDQGIGDLFNVRIAGNFVNDDILGSLEFACKIAGAKVIVVLGHSSCGAVKGACDNVEIGKLTGMLEKLKPAIEATQGDYTDRTSKNEAFVQEVANNNVALTAKDIYNQSTVLKEMTDNEEILIIGAMYNVATGQVTFFE